MTTFHPLPAPPAPAPRPTLQTPRANSQLPGAGERSRDPPKTRELSRVGVLPASEAMRGVTAEPVPAVLGLGGGGGVGGRALQAPAQLGVEAARGGIEGLGQAAGEP